MKKTINALIIALALILAACGGNNTNNNQPAVSEGATIDWDRSPSTVVFRADVTGGDEDPMIVRSEVPPCTVYGDNHVVWTNDLGSFNTQVLEDHLTDDKIREFVNYLALQQGIYKYTAKADLQPASANPPVVESLTLFVNQVNHVTDAFAGWDHN